MVFHQIKNNDPATADVVMQNFTHVNYGRPLLPTDAKGEFNDSSINIGSPVNKFKGLYIDTIAIEDHFQRNYAAHGDIHFTDENKTDKTLPAGEPGMFLKTNGPGHDPQWEAFPEFSKQYIMQTDWEEFPYVDIAYTVFETFSYTEDMDADWYSYSYPPHMTENIIDINQNNNLLPKKLVLPEPIDPQRDLIHIEFQGYGTSEYDQKIYPIDMHSNVLHGVDHFVPHRWKRKKISTSVDIDPKETNFGYAQGLLWTLEEDNQTIWWGKSHPIDTILGYMTIPIKEHDIKTWQGKPWGFLKEASWGGFAKAFVYKYTYDHVKKEIDYEVKKRYTRLNLAKSHYTYSQSPYISAIKPEPMILPYHRYNQKPVAGSFHEYKIHNKDNPDFNDHTQSVGLSNPWDIDIGNFNV